MNYDANYSPMWRGIACAMIEEASKAGEDAEEVVNSFIIAVRESALEFSGYGEHEVSRLSALLLTGTKPPADKAMLLQQDISGDKR